MTLCAQPVDLRLRIVVATLMSAACGHPSVGRKVPPSDVDAPAPALEPPTDDPAILKADLGSCSGQSFLSPVVADLNQDGSDDLIVACPGTIGITFGGSEGLGNAVQVSIPAVAHSATAIQSAGSPAIVVSGRGWGPAVVVVDDELGSPKARLAWTGEETWGVHLLADRSVPAGNVYAVEGRQLTERTWDPENERLSILRTWDLPKGLWGGVPLLTSLRDGVENDLVDLVDLVIVGSKSARTRDDSFRSAVYTATWRDDRLHLDTPVTSEHEGPAKVLPHATTHGVVLASMDHIRLMEWDGTALAPSFDLDLRRSLARTYEGVQPISAFVHHRGDERWCVEVLATGWRIEEGVQVSDSLLGEWTVVGNDAHESWGILRGMDAVAMVRGDFDGDGVESTLIINGSRHEHIVTHSEWVGCR